MGKTQNYFKQDKLFKSMNKIKEQSLLSDSFVCFAGLSAEWGSQYLVLASRFFTFIPN